ncbi:hypothetical protein LTR66_006400 [Elasticomyces elasticus]|nr:hypothetical protein LTR66_006400 [Elasticomyces elasticus]
MLYRVAEANSYLVIAGAGIEKLRIRKKSWVYPFHRCMTISITPFDFTMSLQAMTKEKLRFSLPAVFTIDPKDNDESLTSYASLLTGHSDGSPQKGVVGAGGNHVQDIVKGIIEGETRSIVSRMTMEELFNDRQMFKTEVIRNVQDELDQFGLKIYNANVKELQDTEDSKYFSYFGKKAHEGASNQAKVDIADARMRGEIGEAEKQGQQKQSVAQTHARTAVAETERKKEKASAEASLKKREIEIARELNLEQIEAQRAAESRDTELQKNVEQKRADMELERLRATTVTQAKISRESAQQKADADLYIQTKSADGEKYNQQAEAEATSYRTAKDADADYYKLTKAAEASLIAKEKEAQANFIFREREAEATYITKKKEAAGIMEMSKAYGALADVLGGPQGLMQYLMLQNKQYEKLANANAKAINGLQPKINVWNTGAQDGAGADPTAPVRNLFQCLPPLLSTIQDQTGMAPPSWLAQMPQQTESQAPDSQVAKRQQLSNGINGHK